MKFTLHILAVGSLFAQQSFVISQTQANGSTVSNQVIFPALNLLKGDTVIAFITNNTTSVTGVTDTAGNAFAACTNNTAGNALEMWQSAKVATANASDVVTATVNTSIAFLSGIVSQYRGTGAMDTGQYGTATSVTSVTTPSFTPTNSGNLNAGMAHCGGCGAITWAAGSGYSLRTNLSAQAVQTEDRFNSPGGSQTASISVSSGGPGNMQLAVCSFKPNNSARLPMLGVSWLRIPMVLSPWAARAWKEQ